MCMYMYAYTHVKSRRRMTPCDSLVSAMGWVRLVGSLKSEVSFAEYRLFYWALLRKRPIILRSLLISATPYLAPCEGLIYICIYVYVNVYVYVYIYNKVLMRRVSCLAVSAM